MWIKKTLLGMWFYEMYLYVCGVVCVCARACMWFSKQQTRKMNLFLFCFISFLDKNVSEYIKHSNDLFALIQ